MTIAHEGSVTAPRDTATGGGAAIATYFATHRGLLLGYARKIAGDVIDPQDLLAEALACGVRRVTSGGTIDNVGAYLFTAMRNRVRDEIRSPRSRHVALVETDVHSDDRAFRSADLHHERLLVRRALRALPVDQRVALLRTAVGGDRARDLTEELHRPATAIHALLYRAKANLRRALMRELLMLRKAGTDCWTLVESMPDRFWRSATPVPAAPRPRHLTECHRCPPAWAHFAALSRAVEG